MPEFKPWSQFYDISTAHITQHDAELLDRSYDEYPNGPLGVWRHPEFGWFLHVPDEPGLRRDYFSEWDFSEAFWNLLEELRRAGIDYIRLDRDGGDPIEGLPTFDW